MADLEASVPPVGAWHERVRRLGDRFAERMQAHGPPAPPLWVPWHLAHWRYEPEAGAVRYPDLEDCPALVVSQLAARLGLADAALARAIAVALAPLAGYHALFYHWRAAAGQLGSELAREAWAADRLATAYMKAHDADRPSVAIAVATRLLRQRPEAGAACERSEARQPFELHLGELALMQLAQARRLADPAFKLEPLVAALLAPPALPEAS